jgi:hypothetical protein
MNPLLIIPLIALDVLGALLLAFGVAVQFRPETDLLRPLVERQLGIPMMVAGALLMVICGPLMIRWFLISMRERGR